MSIIAGKTIEPNASKTIEPNASNIIEQIANEQKEITRNQTSFNPHLKSYLDNLPIKSLTTQFGINTDNQIYISTMDR